MAHVSDIKLIRTDTTLDLSQKAEKGMSYSSSRTVLYTHVRSDWSLNSAMWDLVKFRLFSVRC
ncbi:hypothetical protein SESBI_02229 [Sesbania bispinosa]|nr:hypothetical protein SESBI_02228 [Sesbania bispinosa]KAJ1439998.1 hypothetical protein SESBI_02229 [Sesbania bispinosa]